MKNLSLDNGLMFYDVVEPISQIILNSLENYYCFNSSTKSWLKKELVG